MLSDSPPDRDLQWTETGIAASFKFINKLYELVEKYKNYKSDCSQDIGIMNELKVIINEISENIETFQFNKSVAKIYEFVNILNDGLLKDKLTQKGFKWSLEKLSILLQPFAPHISEEMWSNLGNESLCINEVWPLEDVKKKTIIKIAVQINGKTKAIIEIDGKLSKKEVFEKVQAIDKIKRSLLSKNIIREIYVPGKIVNLVVK